MRYFYLIVLAFLVTLTSCRKVAKETLNRIPSKTVIVPFKGVAKKASVIIK